MSRAPVGVLALTVLSVLAVGPAMAMLDSIPERFRHGKLFTSLLEREKGGLQLTAEYSNDTVAWLDQPLNHQNTAEGTFAQRYWMDTSAWDKGDVALLYISGEGPASRSPTGFAAVYGHEKKMVMFTLEHRYYGKSMPAPLTDTDKLKRYLSVDAALDDLRYFQNFAETTLLGKRMRWVVVGGSYAGALSAWFKVKYPKYAVAAWSSSGVVQTQLNFYDYDGHAKEMLPPLCQQSARVVMEKFDEMWDDPQGQADFMRAMHMEGEFEKGGVAYMLADAVAGALQYGFKYEMCDRITPLNEDDPLGQFYNMIVDLYGPDFTSDCGYSTACLANKSNSDRWAGSGYAWIYQCCAEMAYFQVGYHGSLRSQAASTDYFVNQCHQVFGGNIIPDVYAFNKKWGGFTPNAENVIALQGSEDPWRTTGVSASLGSKYPAVTAQCEGCAHCVDLRTPRDSDPASLKNQREKIRYYLDNWLSITEREYSLVFTGNVWKLDWYSDAIELDLHDALDHSSSLTSFSQPSSGQLVVTFTVLVNPLNEEDISRHISILRMNVDWMVHTRVAYTQDGSEWDIQVSSVSPNPDGPTRKGSACGGACIVGIVVGASASISLVTLAVMYFVRQHRERMNSYLISLNDAY